LKDTLVQLVIHAPSLCGDPTYDDWVYIGKADFWVQIGLNYKHVVFENLVKMSNQTCAKPTIYNATSLFFFKFHAS